MRKRLVVACGITLLVSLPLAALLIEVFSDETLPAAAIRRPLESTVLGESRELIVQLPESYPLEANRRYPVIYVLDGSSQDVHTARSAALMARIGLMPELIVVGVPNVSAKGRQRDYTPPFMLEEVEPPGTAKGAGDRFLAFLKTEVIPAVEREYRTTAFRMLAGHSRGGLLVCYSLLAEPRLFDARFAHSPALWREDGVLVARLADFLRANPTLDASLFLSIGSQENPKMMAGFEQARGMLTQAAGPGVRWKAVVVPGADHEKNGEWATPLGFQALFESGRWPRP